MKNILYTVFLLLATGLHAQGWEPVPPGKVLYFEHKGNLLQLSDSEQIKIGNNTLYTFKHNISPCFSKDCFYKALKLNSSRFPTVYIMQAAGPFKTHYLIKGGTRCFVSGNDTDMIMPYAEAGYSWRFNSQKTATVINKQYIHYLDFDDSIKTIVAGSSDTIILSKQYGILQYPAFNTAHEHYMQIGQEPGRHGFHYPDAMDIFDFAIGDSFEYKFDVNAAYTLKAEFISTGSTIVSGLQQWHVINKYVTDKSYKYRLKGYYQIYPQEFHYGNTEVINKAQVLRMDTTVTIYFGDGRFMGVNAYPATPIDKNTYARNYYSNQNDPWLKALSPGNDTLYDATDCLVEDYEEQYRYEPGLGCTHSYTYGGLAGSAELSLTAYRKGKLKTGGFKPIDTSSLIPKEIPILDMVLNIGPNPVSHILNFTYGCPSERRLTVSICDMSGRVLLQPLTYTIGKGNGSFQLDMTPMLNGIYFIKTDGIGMNGLHKIVVLR